MLSSSLMEVTGLQLARSSALTPPPTFCGEQRESLHPGPQCSLSWSWHRESLGLLSAPSFRETLE